MFCLVFVATISKYQNVSGIKLSRNFGQQNSLLAALTTLHNKFDCYITLDVDLQDDIATIEKMIFEFNNGNSIVYGVRVDRSSDSFFKRTTAIYFYKLMSFLGVEMIHNHSEFRLLDNNSLTELLHFKEVNFFSLILFFKSSVICSAMPALAKG